jgi:hypothetical protein
MSESDRITQLLAAMSELVRKNAELTKEHNRISRELES